MENERLLQLLEKYNTGTCSSAEQDELEAWYQQLAAGDTTYLNNETGLTGNRLAEEMLLQFRQRVQTQQALVRSLTTYRRYIYRIAAAAAILLVMLVTAWYFAVKKPAAGETTATVNNTTNPAQILPGGNRALLTLADGTAIELDTAANGRLAQQGISNIEKSTGGLLVYNTTSPAGATSKTNTGLVFNTISTPRGGQYKIVLADGSRVWLNAASTLKFPVAFTGNERTVEITGEAYFEISPLPALPAGSGGGEQKIPFVVDILPSTGGAGGGRVEVLGTHFNVNAYADEEAIKTTLLEGKVKISNRQPATGNRQPVILKPGQQAQLQIINDHSSSIRVISDVNTEEAVAWKNGLFTYTNAGIQTIMRQAARWYDIDVEYEGAVTTERFRGKIARNVNLAEFLEILELNNVHFTMEGKKIIIRQ